MLGAVFERFVEKSPISVMVRASLERVVGAAGGDGAPNDFEAAFVAFLRQRGH